MTCAGCCCDTTFKEVQNRANLHGVVLQRRVTFIYLDPAQAAEDWIAVANGRLHIVPRLVKANVTLARILL